MDTKTVQRLGWTTPLKQSGNFKVMELEDALKDSVQALKGYRMSLEEHKARIREINKDNLEKSDKIEEFERLQKESYEQQKRKSRRESWRPDPSDHQ